LKFPLSANDPLSVSLETKHDEFVEKLKLLTLSVPSLFTTSDVPKLNTVVLPVSVSVAFQLPFILAGLFELYEPHPTSVKPTASNTAMPSFFMGGSSRKISTLGFSKWRCWAKTPHCRNSCWAGKRLNSLAYRLIQ
jgi:hypothetical protein